MALLSSLREDEPNRNRRQLIENVRTAWIAGVLEQSGGSDSPINLQLIDVHVMAPAEAIQQPRSAPITTLPRALAPASSISAAFDAAEGELLILGPPGAGKTTLLLELAQELLARAEADESSPIPVVAPLASWARRRPSLAEWLVEVLDQLYGVPQERGRAWIDRDMILPLLDGLDELPPEHQAPCVDAINRFTCDHPVQLAVCCDDAADAALPTRLRLHGAVRIAPLTPEQIDAYLAHQGGRLDGLRTRLTEDAALLELATCPLLLRIMVQAFDQLAPAGAVIDDGSLVRDDSDAAIDDRRRQLFDAYVAHVCRSAPATSQDPRERTLRWLTWLAQHMRQQAQPVFFIEQLQPRWLQSRLQRQVYWRLLQAAGIADGLLLGPANGMLWGSAKTALALSVIGGLLGLTAITLMGRSPAVATVTGADDRAEPARSETADDPDQFADIWLVNRISLASFLQAVRVTLIGMVLGLAVLWCFASISSWMEAHQRENSNPRANRSVDGFQNLVELFGLGVTIAIVAVFGMLITGAMTSGDVESSQRPNQRIYSSGQTALITTLTITVAGSILFVLSQRIVGSAVGPGQRAPDLLAIVTAYGALVTGITCGGMACLQHILVRLLLWAGRATPLDYARFLDDCVARGLLDRIGAGYSFLHPLFADFLLSMERPHATPRSGLAAS